MEGSEDTNERLKEYWMLFMPVLMKNTLNDAGKCHNRIKDLYGISEFHVKYLIALYAGSCTQSELSERLHFDKANTARAISVLRENGYVDDDRKSSRSRNYKVFLTESGTSLASKVIDEIEGNMDVVFRGISDEDAWTMVHTMEKMYLNTDTEGSHQKTVDGLKRVLRLNCHE